MVNTRHDAQHFDCQIDGKVPIAGGFSRCIGGAVTRASREADDRCLLIRQNRIKVLADEITLFSEKPGNPLKVHIQIEG